MGTIYYCLFAIFLFSGYSEAADCEEGWVKYKDESCLKVFSSLVTYEEGKALCASEGGESSKGTLVMIKEVELQEMIGNYTHDIYDNLWLGGRYDNDTKAFMWDDGEPLKYTNWQEGYPRNITDSQESCIELRPANSKDSSAAPDGNWANVVCQKRNLVLCQRTLEWTLLDAVNAIIRMRKQLEDCKCGL